MVRKLTVIAASAMVLAACGSAPTPPAGTPTPAATAQDDPTLITVDDATNVEEVLRSWSDWWNRNPEDAQREACANYERDDIPGTVQALYDAGDGSGPDPDVVEAVQEWTENRCAELGIEVPTR